MEKTAGPIMSLCPKCKTIQRVSPDAATRCPNCSYPIPPKTPTPEGEGDEKKEGHLARAVRWIASASW